MSYVKVEVTGLAQLQATLSKLPGKLQERQGMLAVSAAAKVIQDEVKDRAPVRSPTTGGDPAKRITAGKSGALRFPGNLKAHITRRRVRKQSGTIIQYEVGPSKKAWYGRIVETGSIYAGAHPFMRPALDAKGSDAIAKFGDRLKQGLDDAVNSSK